MTVTQLCERALNKYGNADRGCWFYAWIKVQYQIKLASIFPDWLELVQPFPPSKPPNYPRWSRSMVYRKRRRLSSNWMIDGGRINPQAQMIEPFLCDVSVSCPAEVENDWLVRHAWRRYAYVKSGTSTINKTPRRDKISSFVQDAPELISLRVSMAGMLMSFEVGLVAVNKSEKVRRSKSWEG